MLGTARMWNRSSGFVGLVLLLWGFAAITGAAQTKPESKNMELVGYSDLQGRSAYQPTIHKQGNRWIAYIGHHGGTAVNPLTGQVEDNGTSILDVTDPKNPKIPRAHSPAIRAFRGRVNRAARK